MARLVRAMALTVGGATAAYFGWKEAMTHDQVSFTLLKAAMPVIGLLDAETAHRAAVLAARHHLTPKQQAADDPVLATEVLGHTFKNPIGLAAGFDKNAEAVKSMLELGFGFVEVGSVTPQPQPGNPKPRVFRLREDEAVINRYGFNSDGIEYVAARLDNLRRAPLDGPLGINLGKNKNQLNAAADYKRGMRELGPLGDYVVVNVSSPNTPGLRDLQNRDQLKQLLTAVRKTRDGLDLARPVPLLVKIAPDMDDAFLEDVVAVVRETRLDGIIVSNTTVARPASLASANKEETGGLSGKPLFEPSTQMLRRVYALTKGTVPLIGVGGVDSGATAYAKIRSGASLVQLYTSMSLQGPQIVCDIKRELAELLHRDGFTNVAEAVGVDVPLSTPLARQAKHTPVGAAATNSWMSSWLSWFGWSAASGPKERPPLPPTPPHTHLCKPTADMVMHPVSPHQTSHFRTTLFEPSDRNYGRHRTLA
ncbi:uncharacterized protein MONBRDRAFT_39284 [Monosiga brevicollis MX1]|uniref:Dihydroorotate dehydrogenase (quinone), mitochondrial n=1 Tax=Monosiga brevicollis TaxID=81824 RepID=A9VDH7_MONBE|nr:uncharacterized protein MONBRDRAFT_39284 [Monosiga brevicollis MX1]EDQ84370.1 predicted protein [Monosiga brevicollis MX1]|eukprot:XP_001750771.1 hypothetical protein [Monosiga brevicollis MX1]